MTHVLVYHQILPSGKTAGNDEHAVDVMAFDRQLRILIERGFRCIPLDEAVKEYRNGSSGHEKTFALTFDDGYEDFLLQAHPVIRHYKLTATVFLVTDQIGAHSHWGGGQGAPLLAWDQIDRLYESGVSFGSHTCAHPHLPQLTAERALQELSVSKARLEDVMGHGLPFLAYPYGESTPEIRRLAATAGYDAAFGVITGKAGRYNIWRTSCGARDTPQSVLLKMSSWYGVFLRLRRLLREDTAAGKWWRQLEHRRRGRQ